MKAVFLTPDTIVDRRILLEGRSLVFRGHEVTIIADLGSEVGDDTSDPKMKIVNALPCGNSNIASRSMVFSLKAPLKKILGGVPYMRKIVRKAYFSLFFLQQAMKPWQMRKLHPMEEFYYQRAVEEKAGVYIACDLPMLSAAYRAACRHKSILVYDAHEFYTEQKTLSRLEKKVTAQAEKNLIGNSQLVITVNESIASLFKERYGIAKPFVIYNCTSVPPTFNREKKYSTIMEKLNLPERTKILLFQGGFLQERNLENLVMSAPFLNEDTHLVLLGYGEYRAYLERLVKKHRMKNVSFLDAVNQDELISYSASADLGVIPYEPIDLNTRFCTPNKLFEFIQAGLPILAEERLDELRAFISREKIGFLRDLSSPIKIAAAVNEILKDEKILVKARSRCFEIAKVYSWEQEGSRFANLIEGLSQ